MATDYKGKIIHSMSQSRLNALLNAYGGKLPEMFKNSIIMTDTESENLKQTRTEIIYDKDNWRIDYNLANGVQGGVKLTGPAFFIYDMLLVHIKFDDDTGTNAICEVPLISPNDHGEFISTCVMPSETDSGAHYRARIKVNNAKSELTLEFIGYTTADGTVTERNENEMYYIYRIEGVVKSPAMVYTGTELYEGFGISLKEGTISINEKELFLAAHPVNSLYITLDDRNPIDVYGGNWVKLDEGYTLWTASSGAGETIPAGLPNIKGNIEVATAANSGAFYSVSKYSQMEIYAGTSSKFYDWAIGFDASKGGSNIYGKSTTVQPPAYKVYVWKRLPEEVT